MNGIAQLGQSDTLLPIEMEYPWKQLIDLVRECEQADKESLGRLNVRSEHIVVHRCHLPRSASRDHVDEEYAERPDVGMATRIFAFAVKA